MSYLAIRARGLGKRYRLGQLEPYRTLRDSIAGLWSRPRSVPREGPSARGRSATNNGHAESLWALKNASFDIESGEIVGVIGANGAGKTTLLKVLSRITTPTEGFAEIHGRVGSLLEVGTGFHQELTGRENVYLNGAILGMKKAEIESKFDDIVAFSEIEKFIDTPVKRYSSGMYVRLAFAVAAHLEPEILLVDEVLAVGDAAFQRKCLGKMGDVAKEGRTVLFVSHNLGTISRLCPRTMLLSEGRIVRDGRTADVIAEYMRNESEAGGERRWENPARAPGNERIRVHAVRVVSDGETNPEVSIEKPTSIEVEFWNFAEGVRNVCVNIYLLDGSGSVVLSTASTPAANKLHEEWYGRPHPVGLYRSKCTLPGNFLNEGQYFVSVYVITLGPLSVEARAEQAVSFSVFDTGSMREPGAGAHWAGVVRPRLPWVTEFVGLPPTN